MTKKDFVALAELIAHEHPSEVFINNVAYWLGVKYPRFDREKFIAACLDYRG